VLSPHRRAHDAGPVTGAVARLQSNSHEGAPALPRRLPQRADAAPRQPHSQARPPGDRRYATRPPQPERPSPDPNRASRGNRAGLVAAGVGDRPTKPQDPLARLDPGSKAWRRRVGGGADRRDRRRRRARPRGRIHVHPQDLPEQRAEVLGVSFRVALCSTIPGREVEVVVRPEEQLPSVVVPRLPVRDRQQRAAARRVGAVGLRPGSAVLIELEVSRVVRVSPR
jgi:hypothetical protein